MFLISTLRAAFHHGQRALSVLSPLTRPLTATLLRWLILPIYKLIVISGLRLGNVMSSTRGFFFLLFTNKYVFHVVLMVIAISSVSTQLGSKSAVAAEVGRNSILYTLVNQDSHETIEEEMSPETPTKNVSYLGAETIQAVPDIDFDYAPDTIADITVPGSIAEQPGRGPGEGEEPADVLVERHATETYTVQSGDTVAVIARRFGITVGTIIQANQLSKRAAIKPGDALKIPPVSGVLHIVKRGDTLDKLAKTYQAEANKIIATNQLEGNRLSVGAELVIPDGVPPATVAKPPASLRSGVTASRVPHKTYDTYQELLDTRADTRTKPSDANAQLIPATRLLWPTAQRLVTQYYSLRHTGMDIDGDYSDAIYAAASGQVEQAGWNSSGYGLQIVIDHEDGRKTRYAHASKLFVSVGQQIKKGQVIAMVGTTGRSTGTHLHFEVYVNGRRRNPLGFIK